ncbi:hypothetical protein BJ508DRAFT_144124 [Ascobolus immersus RN42]|uniref:Uncharacterized protein n=1 Tax=Ascobolus immersus RN42 TaxID=1160509 RepID=A0A3N4I4P6_ASCIM|nr:hypothetical protein BJ508DRAFT_144124 [Ascobolus immersus RN42]
MLRGKRESRVEWRKRGKKVGRSGSLFQVMYRKAGKAWAEMSDNRGPQFLFFDVAVWFSVLVGLGTLFSVKGSDQSEHSNPK